MDRLEWTRFLSSKANPDCSKYRVVGMTLFPQVFKTLIFALLVTAMFSIVASVARAEYTS